MHAGTVDLPKAAAAARAALALLDDLPDPDPELVAKALGARVRADLFLGEGFDAEAAERALDLEEAAPPAIVDARVVFKLGQWLRYVDDLDGARARLAQAERAAREEGDDSSLANILLNRVVLETWAGEWEEAAGLTERMGDAFEQLGVELEGVEPWRAFVDAHAGRLEAVRAAAEQRSAERADRRDDLEPLPRPGRAGRRRDRGGRPAPLGGAGRARPRELPRAAVWRVDGDAIEAAVAVGDLDQGGGAPRPLRGAGRALAHPLEPGRVRPLPRARARRARGPGGRGGGARPGARRARALPGAVRARTDAARPRAGPRRLKRKREARAALEEALAIFRRLGAEPWADRAEAELQRVAVRRAPHDLSATELRIARLAATGLTNQAIAAEVFLTRKAVEANLARAYRKLGIRSRAQLARALDARDGRLRA